MLDAESQRYYREEYGPTATLYNFLRVFSRYIAEMRLDKTLITAEVLEVKFLEVFPRNTDNDLALFNIHPKELDEGYFFPDTFSQTDQKMITNIFYKRKKYEI